MSELLGFEPAIGTDTHFYHFRQISNTNCHISLPIIILQVLNLHIQKGNFNTFFKYVINLKSSHKWLSC